MIRSLTNGPRSLMRTVTALPLDKLLTFTTVSNGKGAMCRRHCIHVVSFTVGSSPSVIGMAIPRSIAGGFLDERSGRWLSGVGCVDSLPGTTVEQESTTEEKDRNGKVSMVHAALEAWVIKPFRREL